MLKKYNQVKWTQDVVKSFNLVKLALSSALILISSDYTEDFILFSFASDHTMAAVLMQKKDEHERAIAFFSRTLRDAALKYNISEKQALALVKSLKDFRIKPTKLVKGQGLAKLTTESNLHTLDIKLIAAMSNENEEGSSIQVSEIFVPSLWYSDIVYVLQNLSRPLDMARNKSRTLNLKATKFCILNFSLYWKDLSGVLLNWLVEEEAKQVMEDFHKGDCGGHVFWKTTANKILREGYY
eukprot:PITA_31918